MKNRLLPGIFALALLLQYPICAQNFDPTAIIPQEKLIEDLEFLKYNLLTVHAGLDNYTSKEEFEATFKAIKSSIDKDMTSADFYKLIAPLSRKIKNGHSYLTPSLEWERMVDEDFLLFPFEVYFDQNEIYVLRNLSNRKEIKPGTVIHSINGLSALEVFKTIAGNWSGDGNNMTRPFKIAATDFRMLYPHFFGTPNSFELELSTAKHPRSLVKVKAQPNKTMKAALLEKYQDDSTPWYLETPQPLALEFKNDVAILKVTSFGPGIRSADGKRFSKFYKAAFEKIKEKKVEHLILDLRGNGGGNVKPQLALLTHLINQPFLLYKNVYAKTKKIPNRKQYDFSLFNRLQFNLAFKNKKEAGVHQMKKLPGYNGKFAEPSAKVFTGKLYVLIDGWSFSATGEVAGIIKEYRKDAIFIGEETGGNPVVNASGIQTFLTLPHSRNRILICLVNYINNVTFENTGRGVVPDYLETNSIEEVLDGKDGVMEWTLEFIEGSR